MKFSEKNINLFKGISLASGVFTLVIAFIMIFSLIQLKIINPLDNPALVTIKEQFDRDQDNRDKAEQVRVLDLMARKAYFSSRWQVETGSYLLLAGAVVFVLFQRLISVNDKPIRQRNHEKPDIESEKTSNRQYLSISAAGITLLAIISSLVLRSNLPAPGRIALVTESDEQSVAPVEMIQPDEVNYPFFRGEGSRGIGGGTGYPTEWDGIEGKNIKWKKAIPKSGKNSPVIWEDKIYLTGAEGAEFEVYCIDKNTGEFLWTASGSDFPEASEEIPESDMEAGMAVPTVAAWEGGVCAIFGNANLVCLDHKGKLLWGKNLGVPHTIYGFTSSLLIYEDLLLVQYDSDEKISLIGIELSNGQQKWETSRQGRPVNSSPVLASFNGQTQVLVNGNPNVSAFNPVSGEELWSLEGVSGDVAASLAVNSKFVYTASDYFKVKALIPGRGGSTVWEDNTFTPDASSPVANNNYLFVTTGSGDVACYNAEKGDTLWSHYFGDSFYASPVLCDNKIWMTDRSGITHVVEAAAKLNIISASPLGERTDCTPAFSEKKIYLRGSNNLYCIALD